MNQSATNRITSQSFYHHIVFSCCCCKKKLFPVYFLVSPDSIRPRRLHLEELNRLHFLETGGSVGNVVLSRRDTELAALRSEDPWGLCFMRCDLREARKHRERWMCVCEPGRKKCLYIIWWRSFHSQGDINHVCPLCLGPQVYFQDRNGFIWVYF